jgi:hypothetical protein
MDDIKITNDILETARLEVIEKYSDHLAAEVTLARQGGGFFERKYWNDYLHAKYSCQEAANKFYVLLHELSK